jgi:uncharacterized protein with PIN domain
MSGQVTIRFYEELNDFLPPGKRKIDFLHSFKQPGSVKDLIENIGIPHTEIDLILVDGESVDFNYLVKDGDRISVYPVFESLDITPVTHLRSEPLRETKFVLDQHLGKLAAYLRMLGFDTLYRNDYDDPELAEISVNEHRILLTCDLRLLMRKIVTHGYFVRDRNPKKQLVEVIERLDLKRSFQPFTRCMLCNGEIRSVEKSAIESQLNQKTSEEFDEFWQCANCGNIYWKGHHYDRMCELIRDISREQSISI